MVEDPFENGLLAAQLLEVAGNRGSLNVTHALVLTLDAFVADQLFKPSDRPISSVKKLPGATSPVLPDQRGRIELETGQHLTRVARARARPDVFALDHQHIRAGPGQRSRRGQARVPRTDDDDVVPAGSDCRLTTVD